MKFETNKEKGNSGLGLAIGYYATQGYTVSIPLNDTQDYDLVVDKNDVLCKIQVKATAQRSIGGYTLVNLKSCGGTNGSVYKILRNTNIDFLFVVTELQEMYEIPISQINVDNVLSLGPDRQIFRVDNIPTQYSKKQKQQKEEKISHEEAMKNLRKVERPSNIQLAQEILETSFCAVGRKYGVSDNAIRKWCKTYNMPIKKAELRL